MTLDHDRKTRHGAPLIRRIANHGCPVLLPHARGDVDRRVRLAGIRGGPDGL